MPSKSKVQKRAEFIAKEMINYAIDHLKQDINHLDISTLSQSFHFHIVSKDILYHTTYHLTMSNNYEPYHISELEDELRELFIDVKFKDLRTNHNTEYHCVTPIIRTLNPNI